MAQVQVYVKKGHKIVPSHVVRIGEFSGVIVEPVGTSSSPVAAAKPVASGKKTISIAESLRAPNSGSFQGASRHAGYRSCRGAKIRCY